ncbi:hypothetical protein YLM1_1738 [Methanobrevibacter olleyae]|uniref:Uncharacterized protein n=1 Tax=Methanobrevibacter olleyae TaxID=294671 RepID=A0A126R1M4_METOL|nr:hypothetical protein YLM1_1738 [Methanobrevibacter olleyae]
MNGVKDIGKILSQSVVDFEESECMKLDIEIRVDNGEWC